MSKNKASVKKGGLGFGFGFGSNETCGKIYTDKNKDDKILLSYDELDKANTSYKSKTGSNHINFDYLSTMFNIIYIVGNGGKDKAGKIYIDEKGANGTSYNEGTYCKSYVDELKKKFGQTKSQKDLTSDYPRYIDDFLNAVDITIREINATLTETSEVGTCGDIYQRNSDKIQTSYNNLETANKHYNDFAAKHHEDYLELKKMYEIINAVGTGDWSGTNKDCKATLNGFKKKYGKTKFEKASTFRYSGYIEDFIRAADKVSLDINNGLSEQEASVVINKLNSLFYNISMLLMSGEPSFWKALSRYGISLSSLSIFSDFLKIMNLENSVEEKIRNLLNLNLTTENYKSIIDILTRIYFVISRSKFILSDNFENYINLGETNSSRAKAQNANGSVGKGKKQCDGVRPEIKADSCFENEDIINKIINKVTNLKSVNDQLFIDNMSVIQPYLVKKSEGKRNIEIMIKKMIEKFKNIFSSESTLKFGLFTFGKEYNQSLDAPQIAGDMVYINNMYNPIPIGEFTFLAQNVVDIIMKNLAGEKCYRIQVLDLISDLIDYFQFKVQCNIASGGGYKKTVQMLGKDGNIYKVPSRQCKYFEKIGFRATRLQGGGEEEAKYATFGISGIETQEAENTRGETQYTTSANYNPNNYAIPGRVGDVFLADQRLELVTGESCCELCCSNCGNCGNC